MVFLLLFKPKEGFVKCQYGISLKTQTHFLSPISQSATQMFNNQQTPTINVCLPWIKYKHGKVCLGLGSAVTYAKIIAMAVGIAKLKNMGHI